MRSIGTLGLVLVACGGSKSPAPVVATPPPSVPGVPAMASKPAPVPQQLFAETSAVPTFSDPDRRTKLAAAFPTLDKILEEERVKQGLPGVAVGVVIDGELAYSKGFGVVDPKTKAVPDADTVYRIGSISKSFTGLALLSLRDDGVLSLDDSLERWIPEASKLTYPARDTRPITLRQLAQHTSGLQRQGPVDDEQNPDETTFVNQLANITLERAPGLESVYSNLGFSLLGIVVSHAAKQPFHDVVATRIFKPLGMTSTVWDAKDTSHLAPAFTKGPAAGPVPPAKLGAADGAGGIYSTVRDMGRYAAFLLAAYPPRDDDERSPIRRATIREAQNSGFPLEPHASTIENAKSGELAVSVDASTYGFGWVHRQTCTDTDVVWHNGAVDSYRADLWLRTSRGVGVVVLSNFENANTSAFAKRMLDTLEATGAMKPRELPLSDAFTPTMKSFLDVYNQFDQTKLQAILGRPMDPREPEELAGYKAIHGNCTAVKPTKMLPNRGARFAFTCERGQFEVDANFTGAGKIGGFLGRSLGAVPPANQKKIFDAAVALHLNAAWSSATYKLVFPKQQVPEAEARSFSTTLRTQLGTCKPGAYSHEGFGWTLDLNCAKGRLALTIEFDKQDQLANINFHPVQDDEPSRCSKR